MVHQHFMLADNLSVLENVVLGDEPRKGLQIDDEAAADRIRALAASVGSTIDPYESVGDLGVGERQRVEILKVLYRGANVLILDEPTAVLVPQEVDDLFRNLRRLVDAGATVIFISHKLDEVLAYADAITVIRAGTTVADVLPSQVNRRSLGELMVGSELPEPSGRTTAIGETVLLRATGLRATTDGGKAALADVSLSIRSGEILGIAGVEGNGQSELCEAILGLMPVESGQVEIDGVDVSNLETSQRKLRGIGYIPFDRQREGLLMAAPLWENLLLGRDEQPSYRWGPFLRNRRVVAACRTTIERFGVKTPSASTPAFALSGGNQQKLIVGREMGFRPRVLLAAHPTRGVDIGAQAAIWDEIKAARDDGLAILLVSADLDELIGLSDRIAVMFDGAITAELDPGTATPQLLGEYMTGAVAA
jgi:simple sugar transport system ATP-binding protein